MRIPTLSFLLLVLLTINQSCKKKIIPLANNSEELAAQTLYKRIDSLAQKGIMIGHQDALAYGLGWWNVPDGSDMYRVSGEFPAVYGWDLGDIHLDRNLDSVSFQDMKNWMIDVHENGGINSISFHLDNPVNGNSSWDTSKIVSTILPGGIHHAAFTKHLDHTATFLKDLKDKNGQMVPVIFRPWHEHNGNWFWWGKGNATEKEYIDLYRFTVTYFENTHHIHHLLYAFSPDRSRIADPASKEEYLYGYPGDEYVDLLGLDDYRDVYVSPIDSLNKKGIASLTKALEMVTDLAAEKHKLSALSETGSEAINDAKWFTERILGPIASSEKAKRIAYVLFWRNARENHHYMAYPGHKTVANFKTFVDDPLTLTLKDIGTNFGH